MKIDILPPQINLALNQSQPNAMQTTFPEFAMYLEVEMIEVILEMKV